MTAAQLTRTNEVVSVKRLAKIIGDYPVDATIRVCAGEWRRESDGKYRFWSDKDWED